MRSSLADSVSVFCGEEGVDPKDKALDFPVNLLSYFHLWLQDVGHGQKNKILDTIGPLGRDSRDD